MLSRRFSLGLQLVLGLLPVYYGTILVATLPNTWQWALVVGVAMLVLLVLVGSLGSPPQTIWPVFSGAFLLLACLAAFFQDAIDQLPLARQPDELIAMCVIAVLYIVCGIGATWKAYASFA
ncbi:MAG TPA: hypothetical protein VFU22_22975 [Roseiflexaceae bacterium]|nr:hypothetical protein [Roseiflexaceae bacterium]